ncbi:hypothetical protein CTT35_02595 [Photobacterium damselae]|nr:hypothetical protein CTT35_02595 [Photobacterium damselae]
MAAEAASNSPICQPIKNPLNHIFLVLTMNLCLSSITKTTFAAQNINQNLISCVKNMTQCKVPLLIVIQFKNKTKNNKITKNQLFIPKITNTMI